MKLISLNAWGGKHFRPLIKFINEHSQDTDIFCFQEMYDTKSKVKSSPTIRANLLNEIRLILPNFKVFYFPIVQGFDDRAEQVNFDLTCGQAIFIKNSFKVTSQKNYIITKEKNFQKLNKDFSNRPTPLQYLGFNFNNKHFSLFNFHCIPYPGNKLDSPKRFLEANRAKKIIDKKEGAKILVGDFNLLQKTKSIKIYEKDMKDLIKKFKIRRTRSTLSPFYGKPNFQKFADYTFVNSQVNVENFKVPFINISDHLPMILEFS